MEIYDYIYWGDYNKQIETLSSLTNEQWNFGTRTDNHILKKYMKHTFWKLEEENKIIKTNSYTLFNTGLYTAHYEPIYVYAEKAPDGYISEWLFSGFYTEYELGNLGIYEMPERANYKLAVPQYFNCNIQLLLPLCLNDGITPDMALVVSKNEAGFYQGHTCLTLEMAYSNARLIAKPQNNWLLL